MKNLEKIIEHFIQSLKNHFTDQVQVHYKNSIIELKSGKTKLCVSTTEYTETRLSNRDTFVLPLDLMVTKEKQLLFMLQSKLQLNKRVFARNCVVKKITAAEAKTFIDQYHMMGYAKAAYHIGLFLKEELIAVASFSAGRKMNRLEAHQRSFELIHFCSKEGITITAGLSKILAFFVQEKHPGDIMTYIDKQFSDGTSYIKCGFKIHSETAPTKFLINKKTFARKYYKGEAFDKKEFYLTENFGNIKLVYKIEKQQV